MKNYVVVTIIESLSVTSMPLNEFVLYRYRHHYPHRQILIICSDKNSVQRVEIPHEIELFFVGRNPFRMRKTLRIIKNICLKNNDKIIIHLHAQRSALIFFLSAIGLGIKRNSLYTIHSTFHDRSFKYRLLSSLCVLLSNKAVCVSKSAYYGYSSIIKKKKGDNISVIINGVDVERIENSIIGGGETAERTEKRIVSVGRLIPLKNQQFIIQLLPLLPDTRLVLIGSGENKIKLVEMANRLGVFNRVEFTGLIKREEVFRILNTCDLYLSASHVEGMPVSVLEAMAIGLYPILSDIPSHREITNLCGIEAQPLIPERWISAINSYFNTGNTERQMKAEEIKRNVEDLFSLSRMHQMYEDVYQQIIETC